MRVSIHIPEDAKSTAHRNQSQFVTGQATCLASRFIHSLACT